MFATGEAPSSVHLFGTSSTTIAPVEPAFDDAFWSTNNGNLYASGHQRRRTRNTYLLRIPYNGAIGSHRRVRRAGPLAAANAVVATSPVTEFLTSAASNPDFLFIGGSGTTATTGS